MPADRANGAIRGGAAAPPGEADAPERRLIVLGSTGSIGTQTLDVVAHLNAMHDQGRWPTRYRVVGLATGRKLGDMRAQAARFGVRDLAVADPSEPATGSLRSGPGAAERLVREVEADVVLGAMVGSAGLPATLAAVDLGRDVALANKETLVAAGELVVPAARRSGAKLLPVDSEHCAVWQCLQGARGGAPSPLSPSPHLPPCPPVACGPDVHRVILTASGGPFRAHTRDEIYHAAPEQALKHPTWSMGPKVTIDSASLTNKALEVIEAHWLFGLPGEKIGVLIHPQSLVHALVEFADGSTIAQLGASDMRAPIQYALTFPLRPDGACRRLDFATLSRLDFSPPDLDRFPALGLAYEVIERGGTSGAVFNAANEAAVEAFLAGAIPFGRIPELSRDALRSVGVSPLRTLADALEADAQARRFVGASIGSHAAPAGRR